MNRVTENSFRRIYFIFGGVFVLFTLSIMVWLLSTKTIDSDFIKYAIIYILAILFLVISFIFAIKAKITMIIKSLDQIIENAIKGKDDVYIGYEETSLSALENKVCRFIRISRGNTSYINEERNKVKSFISDISHQTKTPISNILLNSELLLDKSELSDDIKELTKGIKVQSEKLKWLIESLVKMSRLEVGIVSHNESCIPIFNTISNSVAAVFSFAERKSIKIEVNCKENIEACHDFKWTSEAFTNLLENAIKYTPRNGKININVLEYEMFLRIDIKDNGIGIDKSEINNIFKRFYRSSRVSCYEGVGIGLYLVRKIISSQGGYIKVKSQIDKGSVFSVFLPRNK